VPVLTLLKQYKDAVITVNSPGAEGNKCGFEGGRALKIGGTYHLITTETLTEVRSVPTRLAHWSSEDRIHWKRISTLYASSGDRSGKDARAALWGPMPVYNEEDGRWELFYVAYRSQLKSSTQWLDAYEGRIWRAVSKTPGKQGIGGPYDDVGVILQPDAESQPWEGLQGVDSFFPYRVGKGWYGFYGSANTEKLPVEHWRVGLAHAPALAGPWKRCVGLNPVQLEKVYTENPIVSQLDDGTFLAVYDRATVSDVPTAIGYAYSHDGIHWSAGVGLDLQPKDRWATRINTPLGLIPEGNNTFTVFYTAEVGHPFSSEEVGLATLKLEYRQPAQGKK
jgi:hypothetical protein